MRINTNPCAQLQPAKVYVGRELDLMKPHKWMDKRFTEMGGKYRSARALLAICFRGKKNKARAAAESESS